MTNPVDALIGSTPILDEKLQNSLRFDLVSQIQSYENIGKRYGFGGEAGLMMFLQANPGFTKEVAKLRAMFSSDMSTQDRARLKALLASEELVTDIFALVSNPANSPAVRIDGFKQLNRMGGVDGLPAVAKDGGTGTQFSLTINMPDGRSEKIITTVVDQAEIPAPPAEDGE